MKIGLLGYGRMGREIERLCPARGHSICVRLDIDQPFKPETDLNGAQALIDFTTAAAVPDHLKAAAQRGIAIVEGTTGWSQHYAELSALPGLWMLYSPNFSMGVYRFNKLVHYATELYGRNDEYDIYVHEWHHRGKADSPSGTAFKLGHTILAATALKTEIFGRSCEGKIAPSSLHVSSTRAGRIPGTHEVGYDSDYDQITLRHQAHGREGFAYGAIRAAEWLLENHGVHSMDDFMRAHI